MRHFKIHYSYMRDPKSTQEKRANQDCEYARAKRRPTNLPDAWDDIWVRGRKTWKDRRKTQYREKRGEQHSIKITGLFYSWELEQYFQRLDIPYQIEEIKESYTFYSHYRQDWYKSSRCVGYTVTWWSDKDIGIDYILQSTQHPNSEGYEFLT